MDRDDLLESGTGPGLSSDAHSTPDTLATPNFDGQDSLNLDSSGLNTPKDVSEDDTGTDDNVTSSEKPIGGVECPNQERRTRFPDNGTIKVLAARITVSVTPSRRTRPTSALPPKELRVYSRYASTVPAVDARASADDTLGLELLHTLQSLCTPAAGSNVVDPLLEALSQSWPVGKVPSLPPDKAEAKKKPTEVEDSDEDLQDVGTGKLPPNQLDTSAPPLAGTDDIFCHIAYRAIEMGIGAALRPFAGAGVRIVTMCSGTESPIIALRLLQRHLRVVGQIELEFTHLASAEIEPPKQAFIERNFSPPLLFRDVEHFTTHKQDPADPNLLPLTAYGRPAQPPQHAHILIAGSSCVDFSSLNKNKKKGLDKDGEHGESTATLKGIAAYAEVYRPAIIILENVSTAPWGEIVEFWRDRDYTCTPLLLNTLNYYLPQTRMRGYCLAVDTIHAQSLGLDPRKIGELYVEKMACFQFRASADYGHYLLPHDDPRLQLAKTRVDEVRAPNSQGWGQCQKRHRNVRAVGRLGNECPYTHSGANMRPRLDDHAAQEWILGQPRRVVDLLDISLLSYVMLRDFDMRFRRRNINISQNVDRDTDARQWGVVSCVTPKGLLFDTLRGGPLTGMEVLALQGMPIGDLDLGVDSWRLLQDLAGNAMTTSVVGPAILSAILACYYATKCHKSSSPDPVSSIFAEYTKLSRCDAPVLTTTPVTPLMTPRDLIHAHPDAPLQADFGEFPGSATTAGLAELVAAAAASQLLCRCERLGQHSPHDVRYCSKCFYTCCVACSRQDHGHFQQWPRDTLNNRGSQTDFKQLLTRALPPALRMHAGLGIQNIMARIRQRTNKHAASSVQSAFGASMFFQGIRFDMSWKATYESAEGRLELDFIPLPHRRPAVQGPDCSRPHTPVEPTWLLFAKAAADEAADSENRELFRHPIAQMQPNKTLFDGRWQVWPGPVDLVNMSIVGTGDEMPSWEQSLGLVAEPFSRLTAYSRLNVTFPNPVHAGLKCLEGEYERLPDCVAPSGTLHRQILPTSSKSAPTFLFLYAHMLKHAHHDYFVFATHPPQHQPVDDRTILAKLPKTFRPVAGKELANGVTVDFQPVSMWANTSDLTMDVPPHGRTIERWEQRRELPLEPDRPCDSCSSTLLLIKIPFGRDQRLAYPPGRVFSIELEDKPNALQGFGWVVSHATNVSHLTETFYPITSLEPVLCDKCSPAPPELVWARKRVGKRELIKPHEDAESASRYEIGLKNRPRPAQATLHCHEAHGFLDIQVNITALAHRAMAQLFRASGPDVRIDELGWRLVRHDPLTAPPRFKRIEIKNNSAGTPVAALLCGQRQMWLSQRKVVAWMQAQEVSPPSWFELAISESTLVALGLRLESRAAAAVTVRGGIIADEVGAGKTTTSLALIEMDHTLQPSLPPSPTKSSLVETGATLVLVPKNILGQWEDEIKATLGWPRLRQGAKSPTGPYYVRIDLAKQLDKYSVEEIQSASIVLAPFTILENDDYWALLRKLTCTPDVPNVPGRAFNAWVRDAMAKLQSSARSLLNDPFAFWDAWNQLRASRPQYHRFPGFVNRATKKTDMKKKQTRKGKPKKHDADDDEPVDDKWEQELETFCKQGAIPSLLHLFSFRRLIVDEFTYVHGRTLLGLLQLSARAKWLLSGTPPIHRYDALNTMAKLLGTRITTHDEEGGEFGFGHDGARMVKDRSDAQEFESYQNLPSPNLREAFYAHAKVFADLFMRKNVPDVELPPKHEMVTYFDLTPSEAVTYVTVDQLLAHTDFTFGAKRKSVAKSQASSCSKSAPAKSADGDLDGNDAEADVSGDEGAGGDDDNDNEPGEDASAAGSDQRLKAWIQQCDGPDHARACCTAALTQLVDVAAEIQGQAGEVAFVEALVTEQERLLVAQARELLRWLQELWGCVAGGHGGQGTITAGLVKLMEDVDDKRIGDGDALAVLERLLGYARWHPDAPRKFLGAKGQKGAATTTTTTATTMKGRAAKKAKLDVSSLAPREREQEVDQRVDNAEQLVPRLSAGSGRLRFLRAVLAAVTGGTTGGLCACGRPCGSQAPETVISVPCGHVVSCAGCRTDATVGAVCCSAFSASRLTPASRFVWAPADEAVAATIPGSRERLALSLIQSFPAGDQVLAFCQFWEHKEALVKACSREGVGCVDGFTATAQGVDRFRRAAAAAKGAGTPAGERLLVLRLDSEDAAGWNLQCANRVLILAGLVEEEPEVRAAALTQAIGRALRPKQTKEVFVYHLRARGTIEAPV